MARPKSSQHELRRDEILDVAAQCFAEIVQVKFATFVDIQPGYFATDLRQMFAEIADCFVFDARGDDVTLAGILFEEAANRPIV